MDSCIVYSALSSRSRRQSGLPAARIECLQAVGSVYAPSTRRHAPTPIRPLAHRAGFLCNGPPCHRTPMPLPPQVSSASQWRPSCGCSAQTAAVRARPLRIRLFSSWGRGRVTTIFWAPVTRRPMRAPIGRLVCCQHRSAPPVAVKLMADRQA